MVQMTQPPNRSPVNGLAIPRFGGPATYVSLDIDVLDLVFAPGTGTPRSEGAQARGRATHRGHQGPGQRLGGPHLRGGLRPGRFRTGVDWVGGSAIAGPGGYLLALAQQDDTEQTLMAQCRLTDARSKGTSPHNGVVADRPSGLVRSGHTTGDRSEVASSAPLGATGGRYHSKRRPR
jgi:hypothetical protein